jgi:hypothetical protein
MNRDPLPELEKILLEIAVERRAALYLCLVEGYDLERVCFAIGMPAPTVRQCFESGVDEVRGALEWVGYPPVSLLALGEFLRRLPVPDLSPGFSKRLFRAAARLMDGR